MASVLSIHPQQKHGWDQICVAQGAIQTVLKSFSTIPQEVSAAEERPKGQLFSSVLEEFSRCTTIQVRAEGTKQPLHLAEDTCEHITDSAIKISILNSQDSFFWFPISISPSFVLYQSLVHSSGGSHLIPIFSSAALFLMCWGIQVVYQWLIAGRLPRQ